MPSCAGGGHGSSLPAPCSSFVCDACGQPTLALLLEKKRKRPWLWTQNQAKFLGLVALRVSSAGSSVFWCHHPEIQLRKGLTGASPVCTLPRYEGKRSLMGKIATPKLTTWVIFPNWLRTNMLKSGMKSRAGWQGGVGAAPPAAGPLGPASGHSWKQNQLLHNEKTPFRLGSRAWGPASTPASSSRQGDVVSQPHVPPSLREEQLGQQHPSHRQHRGEAQTEISLIISQSAGFNAECS